VPRCTRGPSSCSWAATTPHSRVGQLRLLHIAFTRGLHFCGWPHGTQLDSTNAHVDCVGGERCIAVSRLSLACLLTKPHRPPPVSLLQCPPRQRTCAPSCVSGAALHGIVFLYRLSLSMGCKLHARWTSLPCMCMLGGPAGVCAMPADCNLTYLSHACVYCRHQRYHW
jgi:hypothetical protein